MIIMNPGGRPARALLVLLVLVSCSWGLAAPGPDAGPACTCATARLDNGWCEAHAVGWVAGVEIHSRLLYDAMDAHGHTLDLTTFTCESCRKAIDTDGFCPLHHIGFVHRQAWFSRLTYELARGEKRDAGAIACPRCRKNAASLGWCDKDHIGMVGSVAIHDRPAYDQAVAAVRILQEAVRTTARCELCALAMVTDTRCPWCKITYKNGKPVAQPAGR